MKFYEVAIDALSEISLYRKDDPPYDFICYLVLILQISYEKYLFIYFNSKWN